MSIQLMLNKANIVWIVMYWLSNTFCMSIGIVLHQLEPSLLLSDTGRIDQWTVETERSFQHLIRKRKKDTSQFDFTRSFHTCSCFHRLLSLLYTDTLTQPSFFILSFQRNIFLCKLNVLLKWTSVQFERRVWTFFF